MFNLRRKHLEERQFGYSATAIVLLAIQIAHTMFLLMIKLILAVESRERESGGWCDANCCLNVTREVTLAHNFSAISYRHDARSRSTTGSTFISTKLAHASILLTNNSKLSAQIVY